MPGFAGLPVDGVDFYRELSENNSKEFFTANKSRYEVNVRAPITALVEELAVEFGTPRVFRPYRDTRFSKDKAPYKDRQGALVAPVEGLGFYVQVSSWGLTTGGGIMHMTAEQVARMREAIDDDETGEELAAIVAGLRKGGFEIGGEQLKTKPRGYADDHPRLELLRHKSFITWKDHGVPSWMATASVRTRVGDDWRKVRPLIDWFVTNVPPAGV